jgi:hypothetical protein
MKALKPIDMDKLSEADAWKIVNGIQIVQNELNIQSSHPTPSHGRYSVV